jgi:hypothetical protein
MMGGWRLAVGLDNTCCPRAKAAAKLRAAEKPVF